MEKIYKKLFLVFLIILIVNAILAYLIKAPSAYSDNYNYIQVARSFFFEKELSVHGFTMLLKQPPLYSIVISIAYFLKDMEFIFLGVKLLNVLLASLVIFPGFFLAKELMNEKKALITSILITLIPGIFAFPGYVMAENLFYPFFLTCIYFIYKAFNTNEKKYFALAGAFIALTLLTKTIAITLILTTALIFIYYFVKRRFLIKELIIIVVSFLVVYFPWLIKNLLIYGFSKQGLVGGYITEIPSLPFPQNVMVFVTWIILYVGFLCLASGIVFFITAWPKKFNKNLNFNLILFGIIVFTLIIAANHALHITYGYKTLFPWLVSRPIGRYVDILIPLVLISGIINFKEHVNLKKPYIITFFILLASTLLIFFPLFPMNNVSVTWLGGIKYVIEFLIYHKTSFVTEFHIGSYLIVSIILIGIYFLALYLRKLNVRKIIALLIVFFFLVSCLGYGVNYYNSKTYWYNTEQGELGRWLNKHDNKISNVLIDDRDAGEIDKYNQDAIVQIYEGGLTETIIGLWINDNIFFGDPENYENIEEIDYIITKRESKDSNLIKSTGDIYVYDN